MARVLGNRRNNRGILLGMGDRKAYTVFHLGYGKDGLDVKRRKEEPIGTLKVIALWEKWKWLQKKKKIRNSACFIHILCNSFSWTGKHVLPNYGRTV